MEIIVSSGIVMLLMGSVFALVRYGVNYVHDSQARLDSQQNALFAMHKIQSELRESNIKTIRVGTNAVLFADPRDNNDYYRYDDKSRLYWHRFLLYSVETEGSKNVLVRRSLTLPTPVTVPPLPSDYPQADIAAMRGNTALPKTVIGKGIETLQVTVGTDSLEVLLISKADSRNSSNSYDDFSVEARDKVLLVH